MQRDLAQRRWASAATDGSVSALGCGDDSVAGHPECRFPLLLGNRRRRQRGQVGLGFLQPLRDRAFQPVASGLDVMNTGEIAG